MTITFNKKRLPLLEFVFIIYLFIAYLLPAFSMGSMTMLLVLLTYCALLMIFDNKMFSTIAILLLLIFFLAFFYALLTDASSIATDVSNREFKRFVSKLYQYLTLYFPAILFMRVGQKATKNQKIVLALVGLALMIYVIVTTWIFLIENPDATRQWENFGENSEQNVANYYFIYAVPMIISVVSIIMMRYRGIVKLISFACIIVGIVFLVNAQYTLSILITVIGILIQIFRNIRRKQNKALFIVTLIVLAPFLPLILEFAISKIPSAQVSTRLNEIRLFLIGSGADGYNLNGRLTLYGKTIQAFFKSPFWGNPKLDFDGHATFLTVLSDTGLLGGIPFYALLIYIYKRVKAQLPFSGSQFKVILIMFVLMGLTNPIHASLPLGLATWFLAPLTIQLIMKEDSRNETTLEN